MRSGSSRAIVLLLALLAARCNEQETIVVRRIGFQGLHSIDAGALKARLATRESSPLPWGKKQYFDRSKLDADLQRIAAYYADSGFPDARVTGFDVKLNAKQDAVDVTVTVDEGKPIRIAAIDFTGFDVIPPAHLQDLENRAPLKIGRPRDRRLVLTAHEMALNELKDHGYPYGRVNTSEDDGPDGQSATLTFAAEPGRIAYFGPVQISGNTSVGDNVIRRELAYKPGDLYQRSLVQSTQRRLYGMSLFQTVVIEPLNQAEQPSEVPTRVTVAEGKHQQVHFGVGYGTEEKARVDAEYHHVNFFGGARSAGTHVRWSSLDRGVKLDFTQPYVWHPHFSAGLEGQQWYTYTPAYSSTTSGGKVTLTHRPDAQNSWAVSITNERDTSSVVARVLNDPKQRPFLIAYGLNPITGEQRGTLSAIGFDIQRSTADSLLNAHHGYQLAFHVEEAGKLLPGTFNYFAISADARHYLPIGDRVVFANRLQVGNLAPPARGGTATGRDETLVPFGKKYLLGGATSIRGWGRYEVSPLSEGLPIGGNSMLAFSSELRAVLHGNLGSVLFLDGGNVWANAWGIKVNDLRYAIGPGVRYQTPIGPIRVDFGIQLNPIPGLLVDGSPKTRRWRVHFSIGQAY